MWWMALSCLLFESAYIDVSESCCENDESLLDIDGDGFSEADGDCNDEDATIYPGALEICDGLDNSCDGFVDQSLSGTTEMEKVYWDSDGDGFAGEDVIYVCPNTMGWGEEPLDCDDGNPDVYPDAVEICDGLDNSCNGLIDDDDPNVVAELKYYDNDGDGYGGGTGKYTCATEGFSSRSGDCDDADSEINPGVPEDSMDLIDQDCDGLDIADFSECGTLVAECAEVLSVNGQLVPFQRVSADIDPLGRYEISSDFMLMSTEMTQVVQGSLGMGNPSLFDVSGLHPIESIAWHDAAYTANVLTDYVNSKYETELTKCYECGSGGCYAMGLDCTGYRLPTSAEWELASRADTRSPFAADGTGDGDIVVEMESCDPDDLDAVRFENHGDLYLTDYSWFCVNSEGQTHSVAGLLPNPFGFYDLQGNVAEWMHDTTQTEMAGVDPWGYDPQSEIALVRGGAFWSNPTMQSNDYIEAFTRFTEDKHHVGFRLMRRVGP